jgi:hypothetical protein
VEAIAGLNTNPEKANATEVNSVIILRIKYPSNVWRLSHNEFIVSN